MERHYVGLHYNLQSPRKLVSGKTLRRPIVQLAVDTNITIVGNWLMLIRRPTLLLAIDVSSHPDGLLNADT